MRGKSLWAGVAVLAAGLIFVTGGGAATSKPVYVTVDGKTDNTSACSIAVSTKRATVVCPSLRSALNYANANGQDNTMFLITLPAGKYTLSLGTLLVQANTANSGNIVQIVGKTKTIGKGKHKRTIPASIIDGSGDPKPSSVFDIESPTQMFNVVITGGSGSSSDAGRGGGIFLNASLDIEKSVIKNNTACTAWTGTDCTGSYAYGGGIYIPGSQGLSLTLYKTTVTKNKASYGGGINYNSESGNNDSDAVLLLQSHIDRNTACDTYSNGVCIGDGRGGGIWDNGETFTIDHSTVNGNVAGSRAYDSGEGGGIFQDDDGMQINHSSVNFNIAGDQGGGIYDDNQVDLVDSQVLHNSAGVGGGGVTVEYLFTSRSSVIAGNTAGGTFACTINGSTTTCQNKIDATVGTCASLYPTATSCEHYDGYGGGVQSDYEYPMFISTTVFGNVAVSHTGDGTDCSSYDDYMGGQGGGVWTAWAMTATQGSAFFDNVAACGGGIYNAPDKQHYTVNLANSLIAGNLALRDGGGMWTSGSGSATLTGMTIAKNMATHQTGGIWDDQVGAVLLGSGNTFSKNTSKGACKNLTLPCK